MEPARVQCLAFGLTPLPMLLTLSAISLACRMSGRKPAMTLFDLPSLGQGELGLHGLNIQTSMLKGWEIDLVDRIRDAADKASCPCLLLIEDQPHPLGDASADRASAAQDRLERVLRVAHRLGCSSVAISIADSKSSGGLDVIAERLRPVVARAERLEINLLIAPSKGLTESPEHITDLIRKVGGFRVGSFPDFQTAAKSDDAGAYLRGLTPYASAVSASFLDVDSRGEHPAFDFSECIEAVRSVGFEGSLSLEYRGEGDPIEALGVMRDAIAARIEATEK